MHKKIPANSLSYILICGGIIILIVLLGIIPLYRYNVSHTRDIQKIQDQIDEQKGMRGVYQILENASKKKEEYALPNPAKGKLPRQDVDKFQDTFRFEAGKSGLMIISLMPDAKSAAGRYQHLLYNATLKGEFADFRKLLIGLGAVPYIDQIEEIDLKQYGDSMEFKMKIWIAMAN
ncbi:MAG: hypothetical protein K4571_12305 [Deltaproteobacteria bacterium]